MSKQRRFSCVVLLVLYLGIASISFAQWTGNQGQTTLDQSSGAIPKGFDDRNGWRLKSLDALGNTEILYGVDSGNNDWSSTLLRIDRQTGASVVVGETGMVLTDIAFTPKGDKLYGVSFTTLVKIDFETGATTSIGSIGFYGVNALAFSNTGVLYAATQYGDFLRVNPVTGQGIRIGTYGNGLISTGDIAFLSSNTLFAVTRFSGSDYLVKISLQNGAATLIGQIGYNDVFGLAVDADDNLYAAVSQTQPFLIKVNVTTGAGSFIGSIFNANGLYGLTTKFNDRPSNHMAKKRDTGWCYPLRDLCNDKMTCRTPIQNVTFGFMSYNKVDYPYHYAQDMTRNKSINKTYKKGDSVFAMAKGRIIRVRRSGGYGGSGYNTILVEYKYRDKDGSTKPVYVMYGHVMKIKDAPPYSTSVAEKKVSIAVKKYQKIAELNDPGALWNHVYHLHLAVMPGRWNAQKHTYTFPINWYAGYASRQVKNGRARPFDLWNNANGGTWGKDWVDDSGYQDPANIDEVFFDTYKPR